jgi:NADPH:quinone reductase
MPNVRRSLKFYTYMNAGIGAYADRRNVSAEKLVILPDGMSDEAAASLLFKGMTAQYLIRKTHAVQPGELLLVHSAAGGVGQILTRWATAIGATVVGTTGSPGKRDAALAAGCTAVIDTNEANWPEAFLDATGGRKARVVYDAVGKATLLKSLQCASQFGLVVCYGASSGPAPAIDPELLNKSGCLYLTRPSVFPISPGIGRSLSGNVSRADGPERTVVPSSGAAAQLKLGHSSRPQDRDRRELTPYGTKRAFATGAQRS